MTKFTERLRELYQTLKAQQTDLSRIAIALYDRDTDLLSTYAYTSEVESPLLNYSVALQQVPSLAAIAHSGQTRVIDDLNQYQSSDREHTRTLLEAGYHASVTVPMRDRDQILGFVFYNFDQPRCVSHFVVPQLEITAYAISLLLAQERAEVNTLQATMKSAIEVTHERNPETGEHLKRMAGYSRLIANHLATLRPLEDEYIEHVVQFSALHDLGKISIPDHILLKPGKLTPEEFEVMKTHTSRGRTLVDSLIKNHALEHIDHIDVLRNIIELHHEHWDGSGYPHGLAGETIPLEARIVAVADVYDALTSERPYKDRLSGDGAIALIEQMRGIKLDPQCVDALIEQREAVEAIRHRFAPLDAETGNPVP